MNRHCPRCNSLEYCFIKVYRSVVNGKVKEIINNSEFWVCQKVGCIYYIPITVGKMIDIWYDNECFYYRIGHLTELNLETDKKEYDKMSEMRTPF